MSLSLKINIFFNKNSFQGENDIMEEIFWDLSPTPLPNTILTTPPPLIYNPEEQCDKTDKNSSHIVPNIIVSVQPNTERLVYTQRKTHQKSQTPNITGSPTPNLPLILFISSLDLDIPIALRKGTRTSLDDPNWKVVVMEEMNALERSGTGELVDLPKEKRTIGSNGNIERYKARLIAKGFTQTYGIDYQETFAPVAKINSIRILLSLAVNFNRPLHQLDIKNAFLNGDLENEVFVRLPLGLEEKPGSNKVCKLKKFPYGLKQSPKA
ncbi:hypothetical protein AAG906_005515 [Vitis piasezkii]